jgi:tetratricopeptide (TPR) repeat protein
VAATIETDQQDWHDIAADYARDFYTASPPNLLDQLRIDFAVLQDVMAVAPARDLSRAAGQLSAVMAMTLASLGQPLVARRWWRTARKQADASGDLETRAWVRDWEVVNGTYENRPLRQILERADETAALVGDHVCRGAAGVQSGRAQALALAGRRAEALRALRQVAELTERMPAETAEDAESMFGWPEVRLHHTASYVYTHTGDTRRAMDAQDQALKLYPPDLERERAQLRMHRATCMIYDGHVGDGLRYAADVLDELPADRHNALLYEVAKHVVAVVPHRERSRTEATEFGERICALPAIT